MGLHHPQVSPNCFDTGWARLDALKAARTAQTANPPATSDPNWIAIVKWIRDNRDAIDCMTGQNPNRIKQVTYVCANSYDSGITSILVGSLGWNIDSLLNGLYALGDGVPPIQIIDPATSTWIGSWANGSVVPYDNHLDHAHINRAR